MAVLRVDVGFVKADRALVEFLAEVFELEVLPPIETPDATIHCLQGPGSVLKVMVPTEPPKPAPPFEPVSAVEGLRYIILQVDELDTVIARALGRGARIEKGPAEFVPGVWFAVLEDPYGNTIEVFQGPGVNAAQRDAMAQRRTQ
jgi:catechol 2,3-dioxygenase-like lactoylglutathione lyase family enzyme